MSRTFHEPERRNPELIARRKLRRNDGNSLKALEIAPYKTSDHICRGVRKLMVEIMKGGHGSYSFINTVRGWEEELMHYLYNGDSQALKNIQDALGHPIYSEYTQGKVEEICEAVSDGYENYVDAINKTKENLHMQLYCDPDLEKKLFPEEARMAQEEYETLINTIFIRIALGHQPNRE